MGGRGAASDLSYQGNNKGSGVAHSEGTIYEVKDRIREYAETYSKALDLRGEQEAYDVIMGVNSPNDKVTIYRGAPTDRINSGDWVFLSYERARDWCVSTFSSDRAGDYASGNRHVGDNGKLYQVTALEVPASQVGWTGKNMECIYLGKSKRGK